VNVNKLGKRLHRELKANPKKAAVLGLLAVGALWFWVPLVSNWVSPKKTTTSGANKAAAVPVAGAPAAPAAVGITENKRPSHSWEQIVALIEGDPRTRSVTKLPGRPNPFHEVRPEEEQQRVAGEKETKKAKMAETPPDPQSLGMVLSSTIVGPDRRVALVNGKAYPEGGQVILGGGERPTEFRITQVHPKGVVLERNGKSFEVSLPDRKWSGRMDVSAEQN
jgi:hypothetical protein